MVCRRAYPYTRSQECSWSPEEVGKRLSNLLPPENQQFDGWTHSQIAQLRQYGVNECPSDDSQSGILVALLSQFKEPLILMLLASAAVSLMLNNWSEALSIGLALAIVCTVAAVQEYRSEQALEQLAHLVPHHCRVYRQDRIQRCPASELVMGDVVLLSAGE